MSQSNPILSKWSCPTVCKLALHDFVRLQQERARQGEMHYGISLATFTFRSAVRDAKEEVIDAYNYLQQIELEQITLRNAIWALETVVDVFEYHNSHYLNLPEIWESWKSIRDAMTKIVGMLAAQEPRQEVDAENIDAGVTTATGGDPDGLS
jgi:hypothetical protein